MAHTASGGLCGPLGALWPDAGKAQPFWAWQPDDEDPVVYASFLDPDSPGTAKILDATS